MTADIANVIYWIQETTEESAFFYEKSVNSVSDMNAWSRAWIEILKGLHDRCVWRVKYIESELSLGYVNKFWSKHKIGPFPWRLPQLVQEPTTSSMQGHRFSRYWVICKVDIAAFGVAELWRGENLQRLGDERIWIGSVVIKGNGEGSNEEAVAEWVVIYWENWWRTLRVRNGGEFLVCNLDFT